jgi:predicted metal-binding membrane protein
MMIQLGGSSPGDSVTFVALSAVMMAAMMLPSAVPLIEAYRGIVKLDEGSAGALVESAAFALGYVAVWTAVTALAVPALVALGFIGAMGGGALFVPGAIVTAAGLYQFTGWKKFCLRHCRSPMDFIATHFRKGRAGALRMGLSHALYCLGCCWLVMLLWFVAGAMSLLWMGVFAALILAEKVWSRGELLSRVLGAAAVAAGALMLYFASAAPMG